MQLPSSMMNPKDARQHTHRYGATWATVRDGSEGYYRYYESNLEDAGVWGEEAVLSQKEQLISNAKAWAIRTYYNIPADDLKQEIDIKAWLLEESELDLESNEWIRPGFVFTCLKNAVHDYARKELGFRERVEVKEEITYTTYYEGPGATMEFTFKTAKAAILLYVMEPTSLSHTLTGQVLELVNLMSSAELAAIAGYLDTNEHSKRVATDRAIKRVMKVLAGTITPGSTKTQRYVDPQTPQKGVDNA